MNVRILGWITNFPKDKYFKDVLMYYLFVLVLICWGIKKSVKNMFIFLSTIVTDTANT